MLKSVFPASVISHEDDIRDDGDGKQASDIKAPPEDPLALLRDGGISVDSSLEYCMGDVELYREVLIEFANDKEQKLKELEEFFNDKDWENYRIRVHAVKSSSRTIGAEKLSRSAAMLEQSSADANEKAVEALYPEFILEYGRVTELIHSIYNGESIE